MIRRWLLPGFFALAAVASASSARAQGPIADAAADAPSAGAVPASTPTATPTAASTATATSERPVRGPAVRERSGRRSRGASTASGALMLVMLVGFMGYYVFKKLRR